jgi:hypothetical protein
MALESQLVSELAGQVPKTCDWLVGWRLWREEQDAISSGPSLGAGEGGGARDDDLCDDHEPTGHG